MAAQRHHIRRQVVELVTDSEADGERLQAEVARFNSSDVLPLIERCCSQAGDPATLQRIDTLEVDLGPVDLADFESAFLSRLEVALPEALASALERQTLENSRLGLDGPETETEVRLELFAHFARTGRLPWWADADDRGLLRETLRHLVEHAPGPLAQLAGKLVSEPKSLRRIVLTFDDETLAQLVLLVAPSLGLDRKLTVSEVTRAVSEAGPRPGTPAVRSAAWSALLNAGEASYKRLIDTLRDSAGAAGPAQPNGLLKTFLDSAVGEVDQQPSVAAERPALGTTDADDSVYVQNAGLVLLWPFLERLFARLELLDGRRFRDSASASRAAGLLQYVAAGDRSAPEYLLPLNKLLCGIEIDEPVAFGHTVTTDECDECDGLVRAAVDQAPIFGELSVDGFRGSFLLRDGALGIRDGAWLLRVERRTYDLVLDGVPWIVDWVRLPWMPVPMRVEW